MYHWRFETHIYLKNIDMSTFVEIYTFDLLKILLLKNKFNYIFLENSLKHMWIKLLKLAPSSYNRIYQKHGGNVSNLKNHSL
jgi:pectate lyase